MQAQCTQGSYSSRNQSEDLNEPLLNGVSVTKGCDTVTPYTNAGIFSALSFSWINPLLALGTKKTLDLDDIPQLNPVNSVLESFPVLQKKLDLCQNGASKITGFTLAKALFLSSWKELLGTSILAIIYSICQYVGPFLIDYFVQCLQQGNFRSLQAYMLVFGFFASSFLQGLARRDWIFKLQQVGIRLRASTGTMIYNKGLKLPLHSKQGSDGNGEFVNLVAVDIDRINWFVIYIHDAWLIVFQLMLGMILLYNSLGVASFIGLAATVCAMLANSAFGSWHERFQGNLMKAKDNRMKVTMETLRSMRILKLQGWEMSFLSRILELRKTETKWLKKYMVNSAMMSFVNAVTPTFVALVTFGSCIFFRVPLQAGKILSALATFRVLQEPIDHLPSAISSIVQIKVSLGRIASFLSLDEIDSNVIQKLPYGISDAAIEISDGNFTWDSSTCSPVSATLRNINLKVPHGIKVAIVGRVGSGKSSLLSTILGEMTRISGTVILSGTKAYVAQTPWIQSGTVQENILFGKEMDRKIYDKIIEACCLEEDQKIMSFGDQTVIGERGINLSGGQKQRIQIARAVYHDADIFLFDDPFSALDAHTGSHLFNEVLLGLLKEKTVVYVTHQVEFLNAADLIMVMKDGMIEHVGSYDALKEDVLSQSKAHLPLRSSITERSPDVETDDPNNLDLILQEERKLNEEPSSTPEQLVKEEVREKGGVGFSVYWKYLTTSYGGACVVLVVLGLIVNEILQVGSYYWLAWATPTSKEATLFVNTSTLISVYALLAIGISIGTLAVDMLLVTVAYTTSTVLFRKMLECVFRAPMSFFDATPSGRILSRCSTDQSAVETQVPPLVQGVAWSLIQILGTIVVMAMVAWPVLIIFVPSIFICIWYQRYYMPTARELSRLSGTCEAPVTQHFVETISGSTTIRSFDKQTGLQDTYMKILDCYSRPDFHSAAAMKWLLFRQSVFGSITFAFLLLLLVSFGENINPAIAGLAASYGLTLSSSLGGIVWHLCHCGTKMISVERILQYMAIPSEAPLVIKSNRPHSSWPSRGEIGIANLQIRYAPHLPLVLRSITCTFPGGMKTGIVGRTGSGKSTLIQALLRIIEPTNGRIMIDGVDISLIGLHDLRSKLGIIPQEPVMFQGTIRSNLDPLEEYTDKQIWETLDKCQLRNLVRDTERKLDSNVVENGGNWSMGQRQLVCLGRVLLKKCKVLLLDEATASVDAVDATTDNLIQEQLKENFSDCTIICIAHRMTSVLNGDMVLLLNNGSIEEFDRTTRLLEDKSSAFVKLVEAWSNLRH